MERTVLVDDLTGEQGATRLAFTVDGLSYEVDLSKVNRKEFDEFLARYIEVARPVGRHPKKLAAAKPGHDPADVRRWAEIAGVEVAAKGKIPRDVLAGYEAYLAAESLVPAATQRVSSHAQSQAQLPSSDGPASQML